MVEVISRNALTAETTNWEQFQKDYIDHLIKIYGLPNHICATQIEWYNCAPWKRTVVYKHWAPHNAPNFHHDFLGQFIDYKVPVKFLDDIYAFDGSLFVYRTAGEVEARCHMTEANFTAINLMNDIVMFNKSVTQASKDMGDILRDVVVNKRHHPYTTSFNFTPKHNTSDPGVSLF